MKPTLFLTAALLCALSPDSVAKPLKVFILAGQSNMEGHAAVSTFDYIGKDPITAPILEEMRNPDGTPRVCDKVWMSYLTGPYDGSANGEGLGKLTAGFGARGDQPTKDGGKIGPEFTFGIYMEKELKEPILIIKTAWGGRSLNTEFRPPSAGQYKLPKEIQEVWDQHPQGAHGVPKLEDRKNWQDDKDAASGLFYRMMIDHVKKVLADPKRVCPEYDEKAGYELAGFVWLQGFNDLVDGTTYPGPDQPGKFDVYSDLLAKFIRDVRRDLSAPKMPFVIGVLGVGGESENGAPESCTLEKLVSWTEMPDDGIKYFSGTATYLKSFEVPEAWSKGDLRVELSLGELRNVAEVSVNGKPLGILWKPPYKVDVTGLLKSGKNELKIDITNLWANRIAGDEKLPREKRVTRITQKLPVPGPHPSGLFGPVQLLRAQ
jgi:hypothetical protein